MSGILAHFKTGQRTRQTHREQDPPVLVLMPAMVEQSELQIPALLAGESSYNQGGKEELPPKKERSRKSMVM